jgi:DNA-binding transcriptional LysR family regulator
MDRGDLAVAVADRLSFRAAAAHRGVTPSALSHSMRQLEERLGVRLLHRTTRSVSLTDAGRRLLDRLRPAIDQIAGAVEDLNQERQRPVGRLRIYANHVAASAVIAPIWGRFLSTYPDVLSLPKTRFEHSDGVVRQGPDTRQCRRTARRAVCRAHPSRAKRGSEPHCNRSRISRGFAEGARR